MKKRPEIQIAYTFAEDDPQEAKKQNRRLIHSLLSLTTGPLNSNDKALEHTLRELFRESWNVRTKSIKHDVLDAIRGAVLLSKAGFVQPNKVVEFVREAVKDAADHEKKLPIDQALLLLNQKSITKSDACRIFGINPQQPRTLERWITNGYHNTLLKRSGKNTWFHPEDLIQFMAETGKRSDLYHAFINRVLHAESGEVKITGSSVTFKHIKKSSDPSGKTKIKKSGTNK
jgi:hypothetical protein